MQPSLTETFPIGARVRVQSSVTVYHHPEHKGQPFDMKDQEGEVIGVVQEWHGRPVSANLPVLVKFSNKFRAHFQAFELATIA